MHEQPDPHAAANGFKRAAGYFLWLSAGWAALEVIAVLASFDGVHRLLALLPLAYGIGAAVWAIRWQKTEFPSDKQWLGTGLFSLLAVFEIIFRASQ